MEAKMGARTRPTSAATIPVDDNQNSLTAAPRGAGLPNAGRRFIVPSINPILTPG